MKLTIAHQLGNEEEQEEGWKEEDLEPTENEVDPGHHVKVREGDFFRVAIDEDGSDHHPRELNCKQEDVDDTQERCVGNAMSVVSLPHKIVHDKHVEKGSMNKSNDNANQYPQDRPFR